MGYSFFPTEQFISEAKKLKRKYPNIAEDLRLLRIQIKDDPISGNAPLGAGCYKIRLILTNKSAGKSSGARVIIQVFIQDQIVHFLSIYDKSDKGDLFEGELDRILRKKILRWSKK